MVFVAHAVQPHEGVAHAHLCMRDGAAPITEEAAGTKPNVSIR
jgi:hypothetical protein